MSPWTAVMQSLHSSLIDEVIERASEPKPTLGLPIRLAKWHPPQGDGQSSKDLKIVLIDCEFKGHKPTGFLSIALSHAASQRLQLSAEQFWQAVFKRAGSEFHRRSIQPITGNIEAIATEATSLSSAVSRLIWTPIELNTNELIFFGVGIYELSEKK